MIIEGMGGYDPRDPEPVALQMASRLRARWQADPPTKPLMLVTSEVSQSLMWLLYLIMAATGFLRHKALPGFYNINGEMVDAWLMLKPTHES